MSISQFDNKDVKFIIKEAQKENPFAYTYLIEKYKGIVIYLINKKNLYLSSNGNREDLFQEGLIGLQRAIDKYDETLGQFESYARVVIHGHLITAIKASNRYKHQVLNQSFSLDKTLEDNDNISMSDLISNKDEVKYHYGSETPEENLLGDETTKFYTHHLYKKLSNMEKEVYGLYIDGKSYDEITSILKINSKKVDNTLQRIKKKMKDVLLLDERVNIESDNQSIV